MSEDGRLGYVVLVQSADVIEAAGHMLAKAATNPVKIILFGSRACGDADPDSDYDFLVIERDPADRHAEMVKLARALRPLHLPADVLVISERYANDWGQVKGTMVHAALHEGRLLHGRA